MAELRSEHRFGDAGRIGAEVVSRWSGKLKEFVRGVLKDDKLRAEGRLHREEAESRRRARVAEADAAVRQRQAELRGRATEVVAARLDAEAEEQRAGDERRVEMMAARGEQLVDSAAGTEEREIRNRRARLDPSARHAASDAEAESVRDGVRAERAEARAEALRREAHGLEEG